MLALKPSYSQDLGTGEVTHGLYGTLLQGLGAILGICGAIPCCPCPNPFREVDQGAPSIHSAVDLPLGMLRGSINLPQRFSKHLSYSRIRRLGLPIRPVLQVG